MTLAQSDQWKGLTDFAEQRLTAMQVPGLALGVLYQDQIAAAGFGVTSREIGCAVDGETLFQIGSITKTFTATAIMRLVERGQIDLDATVRTYLPDFQVRDEQASQQATVRHLLTHVGGWEGDVFLATGRGDDALQRYVARLAEVAQVSPLGQLYSYNNAGFTVLGAIMEAITEQRFEDALHDLVIEPLGLETCFFAAEDVITHRFAVGHKGPGEGVARPWALARATWPAGGVICHAPDLLAYARFHMGDGTIDGDRLLEQASLDAMQTPHVPIAGTRQVGLAWHVAESFGVRSISHGGSTVGQQTLLTLIPSHGFAVAAFSNCDGGGALNNAVTKEAVKRFLGLEAEPTPEPLGASPDELAPFEGRYERPSADMELAILNGRLTSQYRFIVGFPTEKEEPAPPPPPATVDLCGPDRLIVVNGDGKGGTADVVRHDDGSIGYLRMGGRLLKRV